MKGKNSKWFDRRKLARQFSGEHNLPMCDATGFLEYMPKGLREKLEAEYGKKGDLRCKSPFKKGSSEERKCECSHNRSEHFKREKAKREKAKSDREARAQQQIRRRNNGAFTKATPRDRVNRHEARSWIQNNNASVSNNALQVAFAAQGIDAMTSTGKLGKAHKDANGKVVTIVVKK